MWLPFFFFAWIMASQGSIVLDLAGGFQSQCLPDQQSPQVVEKSASLESVSCGGF